ncbi:hypothetical protein FAZ95_23655 [Trinickia violacea]|uniref:Uncharacterized protein n=1 Tax=Trinickia violacea TaxID=2571746 RepID=A0A4P8IXE8_9BURK|nr:hypothetical protein [Trinickia violacea]QCP52183.1 hypothetical protein FAZ95_23655 [Trinickia violacea]
MNRFIAGVAAIGLALSVIVHGASLLGVDVPTSFPLVWGLHVGIFIVFVPAIISARKRFGARPTLADFRMAFPTWVQVFTISLVVYTVLNFYFSLLGISGNPAIKAGQYVLENHGRVVRSLSAAEFTSLRARVTRGFSGHWMLFYFLALAYFAFCRDRVGLDGRALDKVISADSRDKPLG